MKEEFKMVLNVFKLTSLNDGSVQIAKDRRELTKLLKCTPTNVGKVIAKLSTGVFATASRRFIVQRVEVSVPEVNAI